MPSSSGDRAGQAYDRALQAFEQHQYDVSRSWAVHALQENPHHSGARALLARLDAQRQPANPFEPQTSTTTRAGGGSYAGPPRKGPEPIAVDPNVLISRASGGEPSEPIEPTMIIQRDDPRLRAARERQRSAPPQPAAPQPVYPQPAYPPDPPVAEPTVIVQPNQRSASSSRSTAPRSSGTGAPAARSSAGRSAAAAGGPSFWQRLRGGHQTASSQRAASTGRAAPAANRRSGLGGAEVRGALIALGVVVFAALLAWGAILGWGWLSSDGERLTLTKPEGGTITGPGLQCGTRGSDCTITFETGERVELDTQPDDGYFFSGFTGDCAPNGILFMSKPQQCGARFDRETAPPPPTTFTLTLTKPAGGTIIGPGNLQCGTLGSACTAEFQSGFPVSLGRQTDAGYKFQQFTGDCAATGEVTMTSSRTCSATFIPGAGADVDPPKADPLKRDPPQTVKVRPTEKGPPLPPVPPSNPEKPGTTVIVTGPGGTGPNGPQDPPPPPPGPGTAPGAKLPEVHAKEQIAQVLKNYCAALETLKYENVRLSFPNARESELREQFRQVKSLKCSVTDPVYKNLKATETDPAGFAQIEFEMKQILEYKSGGAPKKYETIVTMTLTRMDFNSHWQIDRLRAVAKPPP